MKKIQFPFKDYTDEQLQSAHGDERNQKLLANDKRTSDNLLFFVILFMTIFLVATLIKHWI